MLAEMITTGVVAGEGISMTAEAEDGGLRKS